MVQWGGRTFKASMYRGIKEIRFPKSVSPSPRRALGPQTGDDAVRVEMTARGGTFKASMSRLISEMRFRKSVFPSPRRTPAALAAATDDRNGWENSPLPRAHGEGRCEETFHTLRGTCLPAMAWLVLPSPAHGERAGTGPKDSPLPGGAGGWSKVMRDRRPGCTYGPSRRPASPGC